MPNDSLPPAPPQLVTTAEPVSHVWRLDDTHQSMVLSAAGGRLPQVTYWGPRLPDGEDLSALHAASALDFTGGMLDQNPDLSICPEAGQTFPGQPGLIMRTEAGTPLTPKFQFADAVQKDGLLYLNYWDAEAEISLKFMFKTDAETQVITAQTIVEAQDPIRLDWLAAPVIPAPQNSAELIDFAGRWCGEFQMNSTPWTAGIRTRENRTAAPGTNISPVSSCPAMGPPTPKAKPSPFITAGPAAIK